MHDEGGGFGERGLENLPFYLGSWGHSEKNIKKRSKARHKLLQKYFYKFFPEADIEVTSGHHRSNLSK